MQIRFLANLKTGEASMADKMFKEILQLDPLMRADLFKDIMNMATTLYQMALDDMQLQSERMRDASKAN